MRPHGWRAGPTSGGVYSYVCPACGFRIRYRPAEGGIPPSAEAVRALAGPGAVPADCDEAAKIAAVRRVHES